LTIAGWLQDDPGPADRLYRAVESYLFDGYPRPKVLSPEGDPPPEAHGPALSLLTGLAERFVLAHEYGHGMETPRPPSNDVEDLGHWHEYYADAHATTLSVASEARLDNFRPEAVLGAAIFSLCCLDLVKRARNLVVTGDQFYGSGEGSHPENRERASEILHWYRRQFRTTYHPDGTFDPQFVHNPDAMPPGSDELPPLIKEMAPRMAQILELVWPQVTPRLVKDRQNRKLAQVWL
jgi:hypothetical protein